MAPRMMACLAIAALAGAVSCADSPLAPRETVALTVVPATDSVLLTYICGNMFRVRNTSFEPRDVRWDIYNAAPADTGSLRLRGRDVGSTQVDYFVTSRTKGTMRVFVGGVLKQTKANGNKVGCAAPVDTSPLPSIRARADLVLTPTVLSDSSTVSRTHIDIRFETTASAKQERDFQRTFAAQYLGSVARLRLFQIPDSGDDVDSLSALLARMNAFVGVRSATFFQITAGNRINHARFPDDASGYRRTDYITQNGRVWAAQALRLPQAWGCETGAYGSLLPKLAVLEQNFGGDMLPDFSSSVTRVRIDEWKADTSVKGGKPSQIDRADFQDHGAGVASMLTARGTNGVGLAGVLWQSTTTVFSMENTDRHRGAAAHQLWLYGTKPMLDLKPRVLSLSSDFNAASSSEEKLAASVEYAFDTMRQLLDSFPELLIVKSAGNDQLASGDYHNLPLSVRTSLLTALLELRDTVRYQNRILIVGATNRSSNRAEFSNNLNEIDLYAPGDSVPVLRSSGAVVIESGTSFATPLVAGIAGQLLTMDPSLSAADVKALLLAGARDSVENSNGVNELPDRVGNTSDVVYEADAYGSLRLLSARAGTPLCGAHLVPLVVNDSIVGTQAIRYGGVNSETFSAYTFNSQSLAAGGRLVSFDPAQGQTYVAGTWNAPQRYADGARRVFGERDTLTFREFTRSIPGTYEVDVRIDRIRSTGSTESWNAKSKFGLVQSQGHRFSQPSLSPDGNRVLFPYGTWHAPAQRARLGILDSAAVARNVSLWGDSYVVEYAALTVWKPDGSAALIYASANNTVFYGGTGNPDYEARLVLVSFSGNNATTQTLLAEPNRVPFRIHWSDEGRRLTLVDATIGATSGCRIREYSFTGTLTLRATHNVAKTPECADQISDRLAFEGLVGLYLGESGYHIDETGGGGGSGGGGVDLSVVRATQVRPASGREFLEPPHERRVRPRQDVNKLPVAVRRFKPQ